MKLIDTDFKPTGVLKIDKHWLDELMENKTIIYCHQCSTEQSLIGVTEFYCERCGAKNYADGSCEIPDQEESKRQQDSYDKSH